MGYNLKNLTETNPGLFSKISNDKTLAYSNNGVYARLLNKMEKQLLLLLYQRIQTYQPMILLQI